MEVYPYYKKNDLMIQTFLELSEFQESSNLIGYSLLRIVTFFYQPCCRVSQNIHNMISVFIV